MSTRLSVLSNRRLGDMVAAPTPLGSGIGGRSAELDIAGAGVFVKRVPMTEVELRPENTHSTANLFGLPMFYQYPVGSAGFGAWRELAAHIMTTNWVLANDYAGFPLLYHWRVLPDSPPEGFADEFGGIDGAVAYWDGSPAVRARLEAIVRSPASLLLFLEHVPQTLAAWLHDRRDVVGAGGNGPPHRWIEQALTAGTGFMSTHGFVHFDAHFSNILTDGRQLYFADFGLALSSGFDLAAAEAAFLSDHYGYDRCLAIDHLLRHLPDNVRGGTEHAVFLRAWTEGLRPDRIPADIALLGRHGRAVVVVDDFHRRLLTGSKRTAYPAAHDELVLAEVAAGGAGPRWRCRGS